MERLPEFVAENLFLVLMFAGLTVFLLATLVGRFTRGYRELTPAELTLMMNRENALVIDMSPIADYQKAHIPGSRHVAPSQFDPENKDLAKVRERPVVVVCRSGTTCGGAAKRLVKAGFSSVHTLGGGIQQWQAAELPLTRGKA